MNHLLRVIIFGAGIFSGYAHADADSDRLALVLKGQTPLTMRDMRLIRNDVRRALNAYPDVEPSAVVQPSSLPLSPDAQAVPALPRLMVVNPSCLDRSDDDTEKLSRQALPDDKKHPKKSC